MRIFINSSDNPAFEELYIAVKPLHGHHVEFDDFQSILSGLSWAEYLGTIFESYSLISYRQLTIYWDAEKLVYVVTDRCRLMAPVHQRTLMMLRLQERSSHILLSSMHIELILRTEMQAHLEEFCDSYESSGDEIEHIVNQIRPLLGHRLELDIPTIAALSARIDDARLSFVLQSF